MLKGITVFCNSFTYNVTITFRSDNVDGKISNIRKQRSEAAMARTWRDLIPVIKMDISSVSPYYVKIHIVTNISKLILVPFGFWQQISTYDT